MKQKLRCLIAVAVLLSVLGGTAAAVSLVPADAWYTVGKRAAILSAGLRSPSAGAERLYNNFTHTPEVAVTAAPTVTLGTGSKSAVSTATTLPKTADGRVLTQTMSAGTSFVQGVAIRNKSGKTVDIAQSLKHTPALSLKRTNRPQVLITHTHTTECFMAYDNGTYSKSDATRTNNPEQNMVAVGKRVAAELTAAGIATVHDTEIHDNPYDGAYSASKAAIQRYLTQYPTIRVVLDIHRDAIYSGDDYVKPTTQIDGRPAAQIMVLVGMKNTTAVPNTHTAENLALAVRLQQALHQTYPTLARPLLLADGRFNQQLTNGSLLIEIGSHANTLDEACYSGELLGSVLADVLQSLGA